MKYLSLSEAEERGFGKYQALKKACQRYQKNKKIGLKCEKIGKYWVTTEQALNYYNDKKNEEYTK